MLFTSSNSLFDQLQYAIVMLSHKLVFLDVKEMWYKLQLHNSCVRDENLRCNDWGQKQDLPIDDLDR